MLLGLPRSILRTLQWRRATSTPVAGPGPPWRPCYVIASEMLLCVALRRTAAAVRRSRVAMAASGVRPAKLLRSLRSADVHRLWMRFFFARGMRTPIGKASLHYSGACVSPAPTRSGRSTRMSEIRAGEARLSLLAWQQHRVVCEYSVLPTATQPAFRP